MKPVIYQICESKLAWRKRDAGYLVLQTDSNEPIFLQRLRIVGELSARKDWKDTQRYGFFDSGFFADTRLSSRDVLAHVAQCQAEVISFSPAVEASAAYWNSIAAAQRHCTDVHSLMVSLLGALRMPEALADAEMTLRESIQPAYALASGAVWKKWLEMAQTVVHIGQSPSLEGSGQLNDNALVNGEVVPVLQIVLDILMSLLLAHERTIRVDTYFPHYGYPEKAGEHNLIMMGHSAREEFLMLDGLKWAYRNTALPVYEEAYRSVHRAMVNRRLHLQIWNEGVSRAQQRKA